MPILNDHKIAALRDELNALHDIVESIEDIYMDDEGFVVKGFDDVYTAVATGIADRIADIETALRDEDIIDAFLARRNNIVPLKEADPEFERLLAEAEFDTRHGADHD